MKRITSVVLWILNIEFKKKNDKNSIHLKIFVKVVFFIHVSIHMNFKCKKPPLVTVVLKLTEISLKPQLQTVILQFLLEP